VRRWIPLTVALLVLVAFVASLVLLYTRAQVAPEEVVLEHAELRDIVVKTVATGSVRPRHEVLLKSVVSGVVASIAVEPGDVVVAGAEVAKIRVLPAAESLARAETEVARARLALAEAKRGRERAEALHAGGASSQQALDDARQVADEAALELEAAGTLLRIVREGSAGRGEASTEVRATVAGMVLDVAVEEGGSVVEANPFNEGTTIATLANMDDLVFEGLVDESEVGRIQEGAQLEITIGALQDQRFVGTLEYIAPRGVEEAGAVQFEIRAALQVPEGVFVRAGMSANADIVLQRREQVLAVREALVEYKRGGASVQVKTGEESFEQREVKLGVSDGIWAEVVEGLTAEESVRVP
jgi:HlyD family secretion protein